MAIIIIFSAAAVVVIWTGEQLNQLCLITVVRCLFPIQLLLYVVQCHVYIFNVHQDSFLFPFSAGGRVCKGRTTPHGEQAI